MHLFNWDRRLLSLEEIRVRIEAKITELSLNFERGFDVVRHIAMRSDIKNRFDIVINLKETFIRIIGNFYLSLQLLNLKILIVKIQSIKLYRKLRSDVTHTQGLISNGGK